MDPTAVYESLVFYGAPLVGYAPRRHAPLETLVPAATRYARADATVLRVLPLVLARNAEALDWGALLREASAAGQTNEVSMLIELAADLADIPALREAASRLSPTDGSLDYFFPTAGRFDRALVESRTEPFARRWGFLLNMPRESFRAVLEKHLA